MGNDEVVDVELPAKVPYAAMAPTQWPRTMSGDGLEETLASLAQPAQWPRTMSGDGLEEILVGLAPPALWPRTMSGEGLDEMLATVTTGNQLEAKVLTACVETPL